MGERYVSAKKYLTELQKSLCCDWGESYEYAGGDIYRRLALLHPAHLDSIELPSANIAARLINEIRGPRVFGRCLLAGNCQAVELWGYDCNLDGKLEQDHLFPYSLGGPTVGTNRIILCRYHNMVKTCDIHCYPWENVERLVAPWLDLQIENLKKKIFDIYS